MKVNPFSQTAWVSSPYLCKLAQFYPLLPGLTWSPKGIADSTCPEMCTGNAECGTGQAQKNIAQHLKRYE